MTSRELFQRKLKAYVYLDNFLSTELAFIFMVSFKSPNAEFLMCWFSSYFGDRQKNRVFISVMNSWIKYHFPSSTSGFKSVKIVSNIKMIKWRYSYKISDIGIFLLLLLFTPFWMRVSWIFLSVSFWSLN